MSLALRVRIDKIYAAKEEGCLGVFEDNHELIECACKISYGNGRSMHHMGAIKLTYDKLNYEDDDYTVKKSENSIIYELDQEQEINKTDLLEIKVYKLNKLQLKKYILSHVFSQIKKLIICV